MCDSCYALIRNAFSGPLGMHGFVLVGENDFENRSGEAILEIRFAARPNRPGAEMFTVYVAVRFEEIARLAMLETGVPYVAFGRPLGYLGSPPDYREWYCADLLRKDVQREVLDLIVTRGIPFLEEHNNIEALHQALASKDPKRSFTLGPRQHIAALAIVEFLKGREREALDILSRTIAEQPEWPPKYRWPLKQILDRLASESKCQGDTDTE